MTSGEIIKYNREKKKLTISELAYILHTDARIINEVESSKRYLKIDDLSLLAKIFDIDVDTLITDKEIDKMSTGERLRHYRIKAGLSQRELAEKVGLDSTYISLFERDKRKIKGEHITYICNALGIDKSLLYPIKQGVTDTLDNSSLGERIKSYRKQLKISILRFNELTRISIYRIQGIEKDELLPYYSEIELFEELFNVQGLKNELLLKIKELDLPELIAYYRKGSNLTQGDLAKKTDLYQTTISEIERGKFIPKSETIIKICKELNIDQSLYGRFI